MNRKTVCVDLDGTIADYRAGWKGIEHIGEPIEGAKEFLLELCKQHDVLIYTTRCSQDLKPGINVGYLVNLVQAWLDKHGFMHGAHYHDIWCGQGKPIYAALVDDRAVHCDPQGLHEAAFANLDAKIIYDHTLQRVCELCGTIHDLEGSAKLVPK